MEVKNGLKTTEFWLTTAISLWSMFGGAVPAPFNIIVPAVATGLYTIARGLAKGGVIKGSVGEYLNTKG